MPPRSVRLLTVLSLTIACADPHGSRDTPDAAPADKADEVPPGAPDADADAGPVAPGECPAEPHPIGDGWVLDISVAWDGAAFRVAWGDSTDLGAIYRRLDADGQLLEPPLVVGEPQEWDGQVHGTSMVAVGDDSFVAFDTHDIELPASAQVTQIVGGATAADPVVLSVDNADMPEIGRDAGGVVAVWAEGQWNHRRLRAARLDSTGAVTESVDLVADAGQVANLFALAETASPLAVLWNRWVGGVPSVWRRPPVGDAELLLDGARVLAVAWSGEHWGVLHERRPEHALGFQRLSAAGEPVGEASVVSATPVGKGAADLVWTGDRWVALWADQPDEVLQPDELFVRAIDATGAPIGEARHVRTELDYFTARLATSPDGLALLYHAYTSPQSYSETYFARLGCQP